jgi:hypothetical protein
MHDCNISFLTREYKHDCHDCKHCEEASVVSLVSQILRSGKFVYQLTFGTNFCYLQMSLSLTGFGAKSTF